MNRQEAVKRWFDLERFANDKGKGLNSHLGNSYKIMPVVIGEGLGITCTLAAPSNGFLPKQFIILVDKEGVTFNYNTTKLLPTTQFLLISEIENYYL